MIYAFEQNEFTENLELIQISTDFNGSVSNGSSILVYGKAGIILRSIDGGTTWNKIVISDTLDIVGMISKGLLYLGLTSYRWGILSMDNGNNWNFVDIGDYKFHQLLEYGETLVALTENKVLILNTSFDKIKEYSYNTDANYYRAAISGANIYCSSGFGKITKINLGNGYTNILSLSDFGICSDCPIVENLVADSIGNLFFSLNSYLFKFNTDNLKIDTVVFLQRSTKYSTFNTHNNELYYIYSRKFLSAKDSLFFIRIDQNNKSYIKVNLGETDRYISNLSFTNLNFISDNKVLAVGKNNLIYLSNDGGAHWELKSFLGKYNYINLFEVKEFRAIGPSSTFYYSSNFGATWLPTRSYYNQFANSEFNDVVRSNGLVFFKDKDNGVCFYPTNIQNEINTSYTNNGGEDLGIKSLTSMFNEQFNTFAIEHNGKYLFFQWGCLPWQLGCWSSFRLLNDTLGIEWNNAIRGTQMFYATKHNNRIYTLAKDSSEPNDVYSVYYTEDNGNNWIKDFTFKIDLPILLKCDKAVFIESENSIFATWSKIQIAGKDTFSIQYCYKIDLKNKRAKKIIETPGLSLPDLVKIKNKYFFNTAYPVFKNNQLVIISNMFFTDDINTDNIAWDTVKFKRFTITGINNVIGDSVIIFTALENSTNNTYLYIGKVKNVTGVQEMVEFDPINPIYISQPTPNPATDIVKFNVFWDQRYDIEHSQVKVYNLLGEVISSESDFEISKKNSYSCELRWKINAIPPGVYYLCITNGIYCSTARVIVN